MGERAGSYSVIADFGFGQDESPDRIDIDPFWICAIVRLGTPLSFSRQKNASVTRDLTQGAMLRAQKPLIITDDILQINVQGAKHSHKKQCSFFMKSTEVNYLVEILPGDWCFSWLVNNRQDYNDILALLDKGQAANHFTSGLKFIGRVDSVRKSIDVDPEGGTVTAGYSVNCIGFDELDSIMFYDNVLGSRDAFEKDIGLWLTRLGLDVLALFGENVENGVPLNNVNILIPTLLDLIVGHGPPKKAPIVIEGPANSLGKPSLNSPTPQQLNDAPFAYIIPEQAASILGVKPEDASKHVLAYADILELVTGVQEYSNKNDWHVFIPDLKLSNPGRRVTTKQLLGSYLAAWPDFCNKPLWGVFDQFLNPEINEKYTALRVNPNGVIMPTMVLRQIPFTTEAFNQQQGNPGVGELQSGFEGPPQPQDASSAIAVTPFLSLPQWKIAPVLIRHLDVGRSNATRTNFVHIYGSTSALVNNVPTQYQMIVNPPVRDDLDAMRSGLKPHMATVDAWVGDQVGLTAGSWIRLVADRLMGSHLTLNGSVTTVGIQSPICEGDNVTLGDGTVYHIESVSHHGSINPMSGKKTWNTTLLLVNGMRQLDDSSGSDNEDDAALGASPIYPGLESDDNTQYNPGLTNEQGRHTTGGDSRRTPSFDGSIDNPASNDPTQLDPTAQTPVAIPKRRGLSKRSG